MSPKKINIAIVGFGNIGSYFYKILEKNKKIITIKTGKVPFVKYISAKSISKKRSIKIPKSKWFSNPMDLTSKKDIDVIVELIGGSDGIAKKIVFSALKNKKHVITANKALMAKYGDQLAHIAEKNHSLISADYNQIEMRILADIADVKELKKAFKNNEDIHSLTASQVFNVPIDKVNEDFRRKAKTINFGIIYGITQYGLAKQISVSNQEALDFINAYFKKFPQIKDYMNSTISVCRKQGYVSNIFGRRIHLKGINDKNFSIRSFQERAAINAPIQGSAADIIRLAMIKINRLIEEDKKLQTKMLLQIHDELIFECLEKDEEYVKKIIKETMVSISKSEHHMFSIPLEVNVNSGYNWGEAH